VINKADDVGELPVAVFVRPLAGRQTEPFLMALPVPAAALDLELPLHHDNVGDRDMVARSTRFQLRATIGA
jgi:hypothetical protein